MVRALILLIGLFTMNSLFSEIPIGLKLPLTTPRLILRDFIHDDISQIIAIASHPQFSGYLRFHPEKISHDVTCYIEEAIEAQKPDLISGQRFIYSLNCQDFEQTITKKG